MLTSEFVSVILDFQGLSRGHQEKHPDDIVRNQPAEQGVGRGTNAVQTGQPLLYCVP